MKYIVGGIVLIILGLCVGYFALIPNNYGLLLILALVIGGIFLIIHDVENSTKGQKPSLGMAWKLFPVKILTLLSITFAVSWSLNIYVASFDIVSKNIQLRADVTNMAVQHQNEINIMNQTIISLQDNNTALEQTIQSLEETIDILRQQESECDEKLRLYMVEVYGSVPSAGLFSSWGSITFSANGVDHSAEVENGRYSIRLENNHNYIVKATKWTFVFPNDVPLGELPLFSETQTLEENWD